MSCAPHFIGRILFNFIIFCLDASFFICYILNFVSFYSIMSLFFRLFAFAFESETFKIYLTRCHNLCARSGLSGLHAETAHRRSQPGPAGCSDHKARGRTFYSAQYCAYTGLLLLSSNRQLNVLMHCVMLYMLQSQYSTRARSGLTR